MLWSAIVDVRGELGILITSISFIYVPVRIMSTFDHEVKP